MKNPYRSVISQFVLVLAAAVFFFTGNESKAQLSYKALFLGNSYTQVNNLPQLIHDAALSAGDTLIYDQYTPGGYRLNDHQTDPTSLNKIMAGGWDFVVLQGQSQEPVVFSGQFMNGGLALCNQIRQYNSCAIVMPYMTWGRKNGDASNCAKFPVMCTYQGMDSVLKQKYLNLTASVNGEVSPVSVLWRYLRINHPGIELYNADESHPSLAGSYAAACCFYAAIFKKDPSLITFNPGLNANDAMAIRNAAKTQVFDSLNLWDYKLPPVSDFTYHAGSGLNEIIFNPVYSGVRQTYLWNFGDGGSSSLRNPAHIYQTNGSYTVTLTTTNCDLQGTYTSVSDTVIQFCAHTPSIYITGNALCNFDTLWAPPANTWQWLHNGLPLPETNQYLANYKRYNISGFSVISTIAGCSELSKVFAQTPEWTGYYFDILGDPCAGDTVAFAVLNADGFLAGSENILWYKNDVYLASAGKNDTLFITASGKYECKVVNPATTCPFDTTSYQIIYDCGDVGLVKADKEPAWKLFPNPVSETITVAFRKFAGQEQILIYSSTGRLVRSVTANLSITAIDVVDLPPGIYCVRLGDSRLIRRFVKQ